MNQESGGFNLVGVAPSFSLCVVETLDIPSRLSTSTPLLVSLLYTPIGGAGNNQYLTDISVENK